MPKCGRFHAGSKNKNLSFFPCDVFRSRLFRQLGHPLTYDTKTN